jgi:hypothetical protein
MTNPGRSGLIAALVAGFALTAIAAKEPTIEELKARLDSTATGDRPRLCLQIAERQFDCHKIVCRGPKRHG